MRCLPLVAVDHHNIAFVMCVCVYLCSLSLYAFCKFPYIHPNSIRNTFPNIHNKAISISNYDFFFLLVCIQQPDHILVLINIYVLEPSLAFRVSFLPKQIRCGFPPSGRFDHFDSRFGLF